MGLIPAPVRREVAIREGVIPGENTAISCHWCGETSVATWPLRLNGQPTYWPMFGAFALDHVHPRARGGPGHLFEPGDLLHGLQ